VLSGNPRCNFPQSKPSQPATLGDKIKAWFKGNVH